MIKDIDLEKIKKLLLSKTGKFAGSVFTGYVMSLSLAPVNMWVLGVTPGQGTRSHMLQLRPDMAK